LALLGPTSVKAARKMLVKLTPTVLHPVDTLLPKKYKAKLEISCVKTFVPKKCSKNAGEIDNFTAFFLFLHLLLFFK